MTGNGVNRNQVGLSQRISICSGHGGFILQLCPMSRREIQINAWVGESNGVKGRNSAITPGSLLSSMMSITLPPPPR